jgi:hypothetical protein
MNLLDKKEHETVHLVLTAVFTAAQLVANPDGPSLEAVKRASVYADDVLADAKQRCEAAGIVF